MADRSFTLRGQESSDLSGSCDFDLDPMTFIQEPDHIPWRYTGCMKMNFLCPHFRTLSSERHTDRTEIIHHAASRVVNKRVKLVPWCHG